MRWMRRLLLIGIVVAGGWWSQSALRPAGPPPVPSRAPAPAPQTPPPAPAASGAVPATPEQPQEKAPSPPEEPASAIPPDKRVQLQIGKASYETQKAVPPFLVLEKVMEQELQKPDRVEYDLLEITIFVQGAPTRYLAVGPLLGRDIEKLPAEVKDKLRPWEHASYAGDFEPYRVYELR